ncbi:MAG: hypothetical protein O3A78_01485 [Nitrospinae bacterium]|jgi:hypothetical protein|nr:hypothetical protein [Nitrospinota bacterium]MDA1108481.1 hypothetical protein [Nitrospinota bacterium]
MDMDMEIGGGLRTLVGKRVTLFCVNYIYTGKLTGVNNSYVILTDPAIVFETGPLGTKKWKDAQNLPKDWYVQISSIESFGVLK